MEPTQSNLVFSNALIGVLLAGLVCCSGCASFGYRTMGYGERPGTPRKLYPTTRLDLEILSYPTADGTFGNDAQAGLMCCLCPIGFLDSPLAVVLDTVLLPYDVHMMKVERNQDSSTGDAQISRSNQAPEDTIPKVAKPRH